MPAIVLVKVFEVIKLFLNKFIIIGISNSDKVNSKEILSLILFILSKFRFFSIN